MTHPFDHEKLIARRKEKFWTQDDLAAASGLSTRTIQRMERNGHSSIDSWKAVCAAFALLPEELLKDTVDIIEQTEAQQAQMRKAVIGAVLCSAAGLIGCSFGWWQIFTGPVDFHEAVTEYKLLSLSVTFTTALCLIIPVITWQQTLK